VIKLWISHEFADALYWVPHPQLKILGLILLFIREFVPLYTYSLQLPFCAVRKLIYRFHQAVLACERHFKGAHLRIGEYIVNRG
jgi:hypothetical protein